MITDPDQRITAVNRAFSAITGYSEAEALGQSPRLLSSGKHDSAFYAAMWHQLAEGHWQGEICNKRKNGELYPEWLTISAVRDQSGQITHFVGVFADISSLGQAHNRLDYQAHHDPPTGPPNRMLSGKPPGQRPQRCAHRSPARRRAVPRPGSLQTHQRQPGHPVGDQLLKSIALRLREQLRDIDTVVRLGGDDEFIVLLPGLHQPRDAERVATAADLLPRALPGGRPRVLHQRQYRHQPVPRGMATMSPPRRTPTPPCTARRPRAATASSSTPAT